MPLTAGYYLPTSKSQRICQGPSSTAGNVELPAVPSLKAPALPTAAPGKWHSATPSLPGRSSSPSDSLGQFMQQSHAV